MKKIDIDKVREQIAKLVPPVNCETCYLHKPGNYTRQDCVTYYKRPCKLEEVEREKFVSSVLSIVISTEPCPECKGSGRDKFGTSFPCPICEGTGKVSKTLQEKLEE